MACGCGGYSRCEMIQRVPKLKAEQGAVFIGTAQNIREVWDQVEINGKISNVRSRRNTFQVKEVLGGKFGFGDAVYSGNIRDSCSYSFRFGETYIVYAYRDKKGVFRTNRCSRTKELAKATAEIEAIRSFQKNATPVNRYFGKIAISWITDTQGKRLKIANFADMRFKVSLRNNDSGELFESAVDKYGSYNLKGFPKGSYSLFVEKNKIESVIFPRLKLVEEPVCGEFIHFLKPDNLKKWGILR